MKRTPSEIVRSFVESGKAKPPLMSDTARQLKEVLEERELDISRIEVLASKDAVVAGAILELTNSSAYMGMEKVTNIREATMRLGGVQIARLASVVCHKANYSVKKPKFQPVLRALWAHSVAAAEGCQWLSNEVRQSQLATDAFTLGLMHDIGRLVILRAADELCRARPNFSPSVEEIRALMDELHVESGVGVVRGWQLDPPMIDAIAKHHDDPSDDDPMLLRILRMVDLACHKQGIGTTSSNVKLEECEAAEALELQPASVRALCAHLDEAIEMASAG